MASSYIHTMDGPEAEEQERRLVESIRRKGPVDFVTRVFKLAKNRKEQSIWKMFWPLFPDVPFQKFRQIYSQVVLNREKDRS